MTAYEAQAFVNGVARRSRSGWEQARYVAFCALKPWAKGLDMTDMATFPWEEDYQTDEEKEAAIEALRAREKEFAEFINRKNVK